MTNPKPRVLIAEDDEFNRNLLQKKLTLEGMDVVAANNGKTLLQELEKQIPDLILLDLIMPDMDGFEALTKIRSEEKTKNCKVIVISNLSQQEDMEKVKSLGIQDYIIKSNISMADLIQKVKAHLGA